MVRHRGEELQRLAVAPPGPAQGLAIHRQPGDGRGLLLPQPLADDGHELAHLAGGEDTAEGGVAGRAAHAVLVRQHAQGRELALGEGGADGLEVLEAAAAHEGAHRRHGQDRGLAVVQAVAAAGVAEGAQALAEVVEGQGLREAGPAQDLAAAAMDGAQEELLGLAVLEVEVAGGAGEAGGGGRGRGRGRRGWGACGGRGRRGSGRC